MLESASDAPTRDLFDLRRSNPGPLLRPLCPKPCWSSVGYDGFRSLTQAGGIPEGVVTVGGGTRLAHRRPSLSLRRGDTHTRHPLSRVSMPGAAASSNSAEAGQNWVLCHHPIPRVSFLLLMLRPGCRARSLRRRCRYFSRNGWERERPLRRGRRESDRSAEAVSQESGSGCGRHSAHDPGPVELVADLPRRLPFGRFQGNKTGLEEASRTGALLVSNSMCLVHANGLMGGLSRR